MHETFMRQALEEAARSGEDIPVGAIAVKDGQEVARAHNEREATGDPTAHAEILALRRAARALGTRRLAGVTLYVTLEPCPMCAGAIMISGADACVFGAFDDQQGCAGSLYDLMQDPAFPHRTRVIGGVLQDECAALLRAFFERRR